MSITITSTEAIRLAKASQAIMSLIEAGVLVRNTSQDHEPGWSMRALKILMAIKEFKEAMEAIPVPEDEIPF